MNAAPLLRLVLLFSILGCGTLWALEPISLRELVLMKQTGMSDAEIGADAVKRKLAAPLNEATAKILRQEGCSPALIGQLADPALVSTVVPRPTPARGPVEPELPTLFDPNPPASAIPLVTNQNPDVMMNLLAGKLIRRDGTVFHSVEKLELDRIKIFAIYYGSSASNACKEFVKEFAPKYPALKLHYPRFEMIFVSRDRDAFNAMRYIKGTAMPWPAVEFAKITPEMMQFSGNGIPWLTIVENTGELLSSNMKTGHYTDPRLIVKELETMLQRLDASGR